MGRRYGGGKNNRKREKIERIQERYMRWILGIDGRTSEYMVREEGKREKTRLGRRAMGYEKKLDE